MLYYNQIKMTTIKLNSTQINNSVYKIRDIAVRFNRNKRAIIRWELIGKIPPAKRNTSGERIYTEEDIQKISDLFRENDFYIRRPKR